MLGVSNVSFGLPGRSMITASFLAMALNRGLSAAIINPLDEQVLSSYYATCAALGYDEGFARFIGKYAKITLQAVATQAEGEEESKGQLELRSLSDTIIAGLEAHASVAAAALLARRGEASRHDRGTRHPRARRGGRALRTRENLPAAADAVRRGGQARHRRGHRAYARRRAQAG